MKIIYNFLGFLFTFAALVGVILPVLPTVPFLLLATVCFSRGSQRFYRWLKGTRLYQSSVAEYLATGGLTLGFKIRVLILATSMLLLAFFLTPHWIMRVMIALVIIVKYYVIVFRIPTLKEAACDQ